jgi:hypothetical protein
MNLCDLDDLSEAERERFAACVAELLGTGCILRADESTRELWHFAAEHLPGLEAWFALGGMDLGRDEHLGVLSWSGPKRLRQQLGKDETLLLLLFRLLFDERANQLTLHGQRSVGLGEALERLQIVTGGASGRWSATRLGKALRRLASIKLIRLGDDTLSEDTVVLLLPSLCQAAGSELVAERLQELANPEGGEANPESVAETNVNSEADA